MYSETPRSGLSNDGVTAMRSANRLPILLILAGSAAVLLSVPVSIAQPQTPLKQCHKRTTCTLVPAQVLSCPPPNQQSRPCNPHVVPAHKVCISQKVCGDE